MAGNNAIQFLRGNSTKRAASTEVALAGQPIFETDTNKLYIGDGVTQIKNLTAINPDSTFPVTSVNNKTGAISLTYLDIGAVPTSRTINGKALSSDITLSASDIGIVNNNYKYAPMHYTLTDYLYKVGIDPTVVTNIVSSGTVLKSDWTFDTNLTTKLDLDVTFSPTYGLTLYVGDVKSAASGTYAYLKGPPIKCSGEFGGNFNASGKLQIDTAGNASLYAEVGFDIFYPAEEGTDDIDTIVWAVEGKDEGSYSTSKTAYKQYVSKITQIQPYIWLRLDNAAVEASIFMSSFDAYIMTSN